MVLNENNVSAQCIVFTYYNEHLWRKITTKMKWNETKKLYSFSMKYFSFFLTVMLPCIGPTWGRWLQSKIHSLCGEDNGYSRLEMVKVVVIEKTYFWESVHRKKLLEWNLNFTNVIWREWGLFMTMSIAWWILTMKVRTGGISNEILYKIFLFLNF